MSSRLRPRLSGFIEPCRPSTADRPPHGPGWLHEVKQDGYRLMARRDAGGVHLLTRYGHNWADRYPSIAHAVSELRCHSGLINGEVMVCRPDGIAVFERLRRGGRKHAAAQLYDL